MLLLWALLQVGCAYNNDVLFLYRREFSKSDFNQTFFSSLESYQVNASPVSENLYPWIARVVHSKNADFPHVCTASCIADGIFITAARCVSRLKVQFTTLIYQSQRLQTRAIVIPSYSTKQAYDDIGFIVVHMNNIMWRTVKLFSQINRTDEDYRWFEALKPSEYKVVGYATEKGIHKIKSADRVYNLTELDVVIGLGLCSTILTNQHRVEGFNIPCYHSCTTEEFYEQAARCQNYHGVEGGAIVDKNNVLLGVATWGPYFRKYELPVGFSVVNSRNFFHDYECAKTIWGDGVEKAENGYYQKLCNF